MKGLIKKLKKSPHLKRGSVRAKKKKYKLEGDWPTKKEGLHKNRGNPTLVHPDQLSMERRKRRTRTVKT